VEKQVEEAILNEIVLLTTTSKKKDKKYDNKHHQDSSAPSIGYMKQEVFLVKTTREFV